MCMSPAGTLLISLGCNGRGVALATAMGAQLARRLIGGEECRDRHADISHQADGDARLLALGVTAAVLAGRVRDRLGM